MGQHNTSQDVQNRFTAYLLVALKRKKRDYIKKQSKINTYELLTDFQDTQYPDERNYNRSAEGGISMSFKEILFQAQHGSESAAEEILARYRALLLRESVCQGVLDEDLYQELSMTLLDCIKNFRV